MKAYSILFIFILSFFYSLNASAQKYETVSSDVLKYIRKESRKCGLDNLTKNQDSLRIRIWMRNSIVELIKKDTVSVQLTHVISSENIHPSNDTCIFQTIPIDTVDAPQLMEQLLSKEITSLPGSNNQGIDGTTYMFEIAQLGDYRCYQYWSPRKESGGHIKKASEILSLIREKLNIDEYEKEFFENLPSGHYRIGLSNMWIDHLLPENSLKSSLYEYIEDGLKTHFDVDNRTSSQKFPLIQLNDETVYMKDLNRYSFSKVKKIIFITTKNKSTALFGVRAQYGTILIYKKGYKGSFCLYKNTSDKGQILQIE